MIRAAVLGGDVSKSRSPAIHEAAFRALRVEGKYEAISVDARGFRALVRRLADDGYTYVNVTIPHKRAAAGMATRPRRLVGITGAANTLVFGGRAARRSVTADNTDGYGLLTALGELGVKRLHGATIVMVGAGGAAAGALASLLLAGAEVRLLARRPAVGRALRRRFSASAQRRIEVASWTSENARRALEGADVLVSAVPAAGWDDEDARAGLNAIDHRTAVLEMAYGEETPLCRALDGRVERYQDGLPMLVHQAAKAVELALGALPPSAPLIRAARRA